jgi:hypothetical protein
VTDPDAPRRELYLVAGGTPAAEWLSQRLDDPEVQAHLRESFEKFSRAVGTTIEQAARLTADAIAAYTSAIVPAYDSLRELLATAGAIDRPLPDDPRERALELRRRRTTGPDRQVQHRPRPRRHA